MPVAATSLFPYKVSSVVVDVILGVIDAAGIDVLAHGLPNAASRSLGFDSFLLIHINC